MSFQNLGSINWKRIISVILVLLAVVINSFVVYKTFFVEITPEKEEEETPIGIDVELEQQTEDLKDEREEGRDEDYEPKTAEEKEEEAVLQIQEIEDLRNKTKVE